MTATRIILVSLMVDTVKNVAGNSQLPIRITMYYLLGRGGGKRVKRHECKPHSCKAIICSLKSLLKAVLQSLL